MPDYTQYACPVCGQKFHASDDVVVCPQCGAPHHRTCWKEEGRCHFQSAHGTPSQWKPLPDKEDDNAVVCGNCGTVNSDGRTCCQKCGRELYPAVEEDREDPPLTPPSPFPTLLLHTKNGSFSAPPSVSSGRAAPCQYLMARILS